MPTPERPEPYPPSDPRPPCPVCGQPAHTAGHHDNAEPEEVAGGRPYSGGSPPSYATEEVRADDDDS